MIILAKHAFPLFKDHIVIHVGLHQTQVIYKLYHFLVCQPVNQNAMKVIQQMGIHRRFVFLVTRPAQLALIREWLEINQSVLHVHLYFPIKT